MVLLLPVLDSEQIKECSNCTQIGLCSPVLERTSFYYASRKARRFESRCRRCSNGRQPGKRRKAKADPATREERLARQREYNRAYRNRNPEKVLDTQQRYRAANAENLRIDHLLARERAGFPLPSLAEVQRTTKTTRNPLPVEPFRAWLRKLAIEMGTPVAPATNIELAARLGVSERRVWAWMNTQETIDEETVDRACSREGGIMARELYEFPVSEILPSPAPPPRRHCGTPGCSTPVEIGVRFCSTHGEIYARVAAELQAEASAFRKRIGQKKPPVCCRPGCAEPRARGRAFCDTCQDAGYVEEDEE